MNIGTNSNHAGTERCTTFDGILDLGMDSTTLNAGVVLKFELIHLLVERLLLESQTALDAFTGVSRSTFR